MAVQADERPLAVAQQGQQLAVAEAVDGGHGGEVGVDAVDQVDAEVGQRGAQPADPPGGAEPAGGRARIEPAQDAASRSVGSEQVEVGGGDTIDGDDERAAPQGAGRRRAGQRERLAEAVTQRVQPQVLFQCRQGVGERLGDGAGPEDRAPRRRQCRDRASLQQVQRAVVVDGPFDVLRATVRAGRLAGEAGEAPQDRCRRALGIR